MIKNFTSEKTRAINRIEGFIEKWSFSGLLYGGFNVGNILVPLVMV